MAAVLLGLATVVTVPTTVSAQFPQTPPVAPDDSLDLDLDEPQRRTRPVPTPTAVSPLLERPVSRTEYIVGPADVLILSIFGFRSETFSLTVTPEGTIVVPTVGVVDVGGMTLEEAEREVARHVRRYYRDVEIRLSLAAVRSFKVFVVGNVANPGTREATAVTRVSELIPAMTEDSVARRNVLVRRADGEPLRADLARFLYLGELDQNPVLREGDVIHVPIVDETVSVQGRVAFPGEYAYRSGETLAELLYIANAGAGFPADAADTLRLMRFGEDPRGEILTIATADAVSALGRSLVLEPFDAVFVPTLSHFRESTTATVLGEVVRPGTYPIRPGVTTVRDLVEMAGGFTAEASLLDASLRRAPRELITDRRTEQLQTIPPEFLSENERRILQVTNRADESNVVLDFREVFAAESSVYNFPLQDGDTLAVPEIRDEVAVLGAVTQPGLVAYEPGQTVDYFVGLAGGYTHRADENDVVVLKAKLGNRLHREDVEFLEPGDQIVVPFEEPKTFMDRVRDAQSVMTTISGFVLAIVGLERLWDTVSN